MWQNKQVIFSTSVPAPTRDIAAFSVMIFLFLIAMRASQKDAENFTQRFILTTFWLHVWSVCCVAGNLDTGQHKVMLRSQRRVHWVKGHKQCLHRAETRTRTHLIIPLSQDIITILHVCVCVQRMSWGPEQEDRNSGVYDGSFLVLPVSYCWWDLLLNYTVDIVNSSLLTHVLVYRWLWELVIC